MISVEDALALCLENTSKGESQTQPIIRNKTNSYLYKDIYSPIDLPSFRNSAMDGYALLWSDVNKGVLSFKIAGEIQAGDTKQYQLNPGEAFRIYTGAPVPVNCDLVIQQEKANKELTLITINDESYELGLNIRNVAEQVKAGELALEQGTELTSAAIGYLASLGIEFVETVKQPRIAVVTTGNELKQPGEKLEFGQIYESNSFSLITAFDKIGIRDIEHFQLPDNYDASLNLFKRLLAEVDFLVISGGISVGDYDFTGKALTELQVSEIFYKVKQKPGKPLLMGKKDNCHVFALPGNPAAALSCFYTYIHSSIKKHLGSHSPSPQFIELKAKNAFSKKGNRAQFLKAKLENGGVRILEGQSSNMMHTFAVADALVYLNEERSSTCVGETVNCLLI
jgi:molybdopterin molybdotransferase